MNSLIDKKLAEKLAKNPIMRGVLEDCLRRGDPLWTICGNWPSEEVCRATLAAMKGSK